MKSGQRVLDGCSQSLLVVALTCLATAAYAQPSTNLLQLAEQLELAAAELDPAQVPPFDDVLRETIEVLGETTSDLQGSAVGQQWLAYLQLEPLREAIEGIGDVASRPANRAAASAQAARLQRLSETIDRLLARVTINYPGLELASIGELRRQVRVLDAMIRHRDPERSMRFLGKQLDDLAKAVRAASASGPLPPEDFFRFDSLVRLLVEMRQGASLVAHLRQVYRQPNLRVQVGADLIDRLASRPFFEPSDVNECLFGTRVLGQAQLTGTVTTRLRESAGVATIELVLQGDVRSQNRGYRFPVTVDANGYGNVTATKILKVNESGLEAEPAVATASLRSRIRRVNHPLRIVRQLALREAHKQKSRSDAEGARRLERRVATGFDDKAMQFSPIGDQKSTPVKDLMDVLARLGIEEPSQHWSSDRRYVSTAIGQQSQVELAADIPAPALVGAHSMAVQIHETMVNNLTTTMFSNRTVTSRQIELVVKSILPEFELPRDDDDDPDADEQVEIAFARTRPVIFVARDGILRIGIRGTSFRQDEQKLDMNLQVTAEYQVEQDAQGTRLVRRGEIEITFPGTRRLSIRQIATRKKMEAVFGRVFPDRLFAESIELPLKQLPGLKVRARELTIGNGWFTIGLK